MSPCLPLFLFLLLPGCIGAPSNPAATQPATHVDLKMNKQSYWWSQPPVAAVDADQFEPLWDAARKVMRDDGFRTDRLDYRDGIMTSLPLISKQPWEFWRGDVATPDDQLQATLATVRRVVRFDVDKRPDGTFQLIPKVLFERYSLAEHRITSVALYQEVFNLTLEERTQMQNIQRDPLSASESTALPAEYYYPAGRDYALEKKLAQQIVDRMNRKAKLVKPDLPEVAGASTVLAPTTQPADR